MHAPNHPLATDQTRKPRKPRGPTWRIPACPTNRTRFPEVIRATSAVLAASFRAKHGLAWRSVCRQAIVPGYAGERAFVRKNALRVEGAESLYAVMRVLMEAADVRTGFVGTPRKNGGGWSRLTIADIAMRAIGNQTQNAVRRTKDALQVAIHLGWVTPTRRMKRYDEARDVVRETAGVRYVQWEAICAVTGTERHLESARAHADVQARKRRAKAKAAELARPAPHATTAPADTAQASDQATGHRTTPAPSGDPPDPSGAQLALVDAVLRSAFKNEITQ